MPKKSLFREITAVLIFKAAALFALYFLFFSPANQPAANPSGDALFGAPQIHSTQGETTDRGQ